MYSVRQGFDPKITARISKALQELDNSRPEDSRILAAAGMTGIIGARDEDYRPVRELVRRLGLPEAGQ